MLRRVEHLAALVDTPPMLRAARPGVLAALLSSAPMVTFASPAYQNDIPNGITLGCVACHVQNNDPNLNPFGTDVSSRKSGGLPNWVALFALDSDGDGQTNGEELGDPCGTWRKGRTPPRTTEISNPGRAASMSATPNVPACGAPDAGMPDLGPPDLGPRDTGVRDLGPPDLGRADAGFDLGVAPARDAGLGDSGSPSDDGGCRCFGPANADLGLWSGVLFGLVLLWPRRRRVQSAG